MKLRQVMTQPVIRIHPEETVAVAARTLARYNIGMLPVCGSDGRLQGVVTDRDLVTRCLAAGRAPQLVSVGEVMTAQIVSARPDTEASQAIELMGSRQIRRLPILENGKLWYGKPGGFGYGTRDGPGGRRGLNRDQLRFVQKKPGKVDKCPLVKTTKRKCRNL